VYVFVTDSRYKSERYFWCGSWTCCRWKSKNWLWCTKLQWQPNCKYWYGFYFCGLLILNVSISYRLQNLARKAFVI